MGGLLAGYTRHRAGKAEYAGALRRRPGSDPVWECSCRPVHLTAARATACAAAELDRRTQGAREVFTLLRCDPCGAWYGEQRGMTACPRCEVPLEAVKVAVLGRGPAVPLAGGNH